MSGRELMRDEQKAHFAPLYPISWRFAYPFGKERRRDTPKSKFQQNNPFEYFFFFNSDIKAVS